MHSKFKNYYDMDAGNLLYCITNLLKEIEMLEIYYATSGNKMVKTVADLA